MTPIITLTTDFGTKDSYVASMKGVILNINPDAKIIDLSHEISPQDIIEANFFVASACPYFPEGTIHVIVIDPGVGTPRLPLAIKVGSHYFIAPDNGVLTLLMEEIGYDQIRVIENSKIMFENISKTFHGRDIFAPAAAHLSNGFSFADIGKKIDELMKIDIPKPVLSGDSIVGKIIHIDKFGNLITNIKSNMLSYSKKSEIKIKKLQLNGINNIYDDVRSGKALSLIGSSGYLEISINQGNAKDILCAKIGEKVVVKTI